jgi:hypothetical protein
VRLRVIAWAPVGVKERHVEERQAAVLTDADAVVGREGEDLEHGTAVGFGAGERESEHGLDSYEHMFAPASDEVGIYAEEQAFA